MTNIKYARKYIQRGASITECALTLAIIALVSVGSLKVLGNESNNTINYASDQIASALDGGGSNTSNETNAITNEECKKDPTNPLCSADTGGKP